MLWGLLEFVRDLAVIAAAVGIAKWAWDQHTLGPDRRDEEAKAAMAREREIADMRGEAGRWGARMEALAVDISTRLDEVLTREREAEGREALKLSIHRVLHATDDPFLTLDEIRKSIAGTAGDGHARSAEPGAEVEAGEAEVRRALIELVADGVVVQLVRDCYFIASDYDTDEDG